MESLKGSVGWRQRDFPLAHQSMFADSTHSHALPAEPTAAHVPAVWAVAPSGHGRSMDVLVGQLPGSRADHSTECFISWPGIVLFPGRRHWLQLLFPVALWLSSWKCAVALHATWDSQQELRKSLKLIRWMMLSFFGGSHSLQLGSVGR